MDDNLLMSDDELSSDEEALMNDIETLKAFAKEPDAETTNEPPVIDGPLDALRLISSGLADVAPTTSNVLVLNNVVICSLRHMEAQIKEKLRTNAYEQETIKAAIRAFEVDNKQTRYAVVQKCGMPYFTTLCGWTQPKNNYTKIHEARGYSTPMQHFQPVCHWFHAENTKLRNLVVQLDKETNLRILEDRMKKLKSSGGSVKQLSLLQRECATLHLEKNPKITTDIDWLRIAASMSMDFSHVDCEYQWRYIVNPEINQTPWSNAENAKLHEIARANHFQSWDKIATTLGTNRSPLACCYKFQRTLLEDSRPWTMDDDFKLHEMMKCFGSTGRAISKIAMLHVNRSVNEVRRRCNYFRRSQKTKMGPLVAAPITLKPFLKNYSEKVENQLKLRYKRLCCKDNVSSETDMALVKSVFQHGRNWKLIAEEICALDPDMARKRYKNITNLIQEAAAMIGLNNVPGILPCTISEKDVSEMLSILTFLREKSVARYGIVFDTKSAIMNLIEILRTSYRNTFGPRYKATCKMEEAMHRAKDLKAISSMLCIDFNPANVQERIDAYTEATGLRPDENIPLNGFIEPIIDAPTPDCSPFHGRYLMPPNILNLVGVRSFLTARSLLCQQSTLPLTKINGTVINRSIPIEERMDYTQAKELLRQRMQVLFYLPIVMSKFSVTNLDYVEKPSRVKKQPVARPMSRAKRKKFMGHLSNQRWKQQEKEGKRKLKLDNNA